MRDDVQRTGFSLMQIEYMMALCPEPIELSIGTVKKPTLREIGKLTYEKFSFYEYLMKMTPEIYYTKIDSNKGKEYWESLSDTEKRDMQLFDVIIKETALLNAYLELFNFFFYEKVIFREEYYLILREDLKESDEVNIENIRGLIGKENLNEILDLLQQICCIQTKKEKPKELKFKNALAKKIYEKSHKTNKEEKPKEEPDINLTLPNLISAVSNRHPSLNPINIWDLTVFQLLDSFSRTQNNVVYDINSTRISVWGDEKESFDISLWYKNEYDKD